MAGKFTEQGGAATMDPSLLRRWVTSRLLNRLTDPGRRNAAAARAEQQRLQTGAGHIVEYFHQLDDPYSLLAAQCIGPLLAHYDISIRWHLVPGPSGANLPEPELLPALARDDAVAAAPFYGLQCPPLFAPSAALLQRAQRIFSATPEAGLVEAAEALSSAVLTNNADALDVLARRHGESSDAERDAMLASGEARRTALHHYSGAMFYYGGEWYWGVDRLYHLEQRLQALDALRRPMNACLYPRPPIRTGPRRDKGTMTLEFYASLRSPYTALIYDTVVSLARESGINLVVRPVLPMVMRGVSATRDKGFYIFSDAAREAAALGVPYGPFYDPIGEPVRRCYSLLPLAEAKGKKVELMSSFLRAAFAEGRNTTRKRTLKRIAQRAGLSWREAKAQLGKSGWESALEANREAMYAFNCWGVPAFRLLDSNGATLVTAWGQDRLWLVAEVLQKTLAEAAQQES
ncbi:2-hydroxychromene-2-carboxylate isomerase [Kineobactrum sediminis]|uniref:2-hydroxychromene-2-carboxylate isomerase n=1 Tax=Kineobactrum sediminis TaxID=1905677 RepID=A0A2N5Y2N5_9GAMM|nr:DsbA family protein [Kineobactrum sediminis]PLW82646.1 2-hydroxychromene-2-carboxylate isomerase [Kineobactrum sediminis]